MAHWSRWGRVGTAPRESGGAIVLAFDTDGDLLRLPRLCVSRTPADDRVVLQVHVACRETRAEAAATVLCNQWKMLQPLVVAPTDSPHSTTTRPLCGL